MHIYAKRHSVELVLTALPEADSPACAVCGSNHLQPYSSTTRAVFSRTTEDALSIFKRLNFAGVQLIAVSQGSVAMMNNRNARDGSRPCGFPFTCANWLENSPRNEGWALRGLHTGGRILVMTPLSRRRRGEKSRREPFEAATVKRISNFPLAPLLKTITRKLNAEHVSLRARGKTESGGEWCPTAIREMLKKRVYIGNVVWTDQVCEGAGTNSASAGRAPNQNGCELPIRSCRRPTELWSAVRDRFAALPGFGVIQEPRSRAAIHDDPYLFSGLLKCGECGRESDYRHGRRNASA